MAANWMASKRAPPDWTHAALGSHRTSPRSLFRQAETPWRYGWGATTACSC